jgi:hypothetical protein
LNRKALAIEGGAFLGAAGLVVGVHVAATTVAGLRHDRDAYRAEAGRARPTATTTHIVTERPAATGTTTAGRPSTPAGAPPVRAVTFPTAGGRAGNPPAPARPGSSAPSGPRPSAPPERCTVAATVALIRACVAIGR